MPLNKLDNFLKNVEGRILYVSPSDLDSTDDITNEGNSQTRPFKSLQRALIEAARFSYNIGNNNDLVEKTTILLMPGEYLIDNRPGYGIYKDGNSAKALTPSGGPADASIFHLTLDSNFDINQSDNILYKYNSVYGGVIVPRGTSIVGLDLRKTKIRPKYVPNPTDDTATSAIFRITGGCYFWQFSIFDGNQNSEVYINNSDVERPTFSHHKLTVFEYADGINEHPTTKIDDLNMYYHKLSVAYASASTRNVQDKYPASTRGFASRRPEYEIVGAFASDPIAITNIKAGDGVYATNEVTVETLTDHNLDLGTPIKVNGVSPSDYNVSAVVTQTFPDDSKKFRYTLADYNPGLETPANDVTGATVTIETDTVDGASPYIFNCSLRSVYGMNGMKADGNKATGFKSMVVAQFTGVSLQKDDRAFVKYNKSNREYEGINIVATQPPRLAQESSPTNPSRIYHLDSDAIYRSGWETTHVSITNDAILQIVSVFAIGYNKHFAAESGGDASITNSNSNFGQIALVSDGFKRDAFEKDDTSYLTHIITPKAITPDEEEIDWMRFSADTGGNGVSNDGKVYLDGFTSEDIKPPALTQGYRIGAKKEDKIFVKDAGGEEKWAYVNMTVKDDATDTISILGTTRSVKEYSISTPGSNQFTTSVNHNLSKGERVLIRSEDGDLPENIEEDIVYYIIKSPGTTQFKLASSKSNADLGVAIDVTGGTNLKVLSRVTDKESGDIGHPIQWDGTNNQWYIATNSQADQNSQGATLFAYLNSIKGAGVKTEPSYVKRISDNRILDDKIYKLRLTVPGETLLAKNPENGFIMQESSKTGYRKNEDFTIDTDTTDLTRSDYDYARNLRYIRSATYNSSIQRVTIGGNRAHNFNVGDTIHIKGLKSTGNTTGDDNIGYNGTFIVDGITDSMSFTYYPGRSLAAAATNPFIGNVASNDLNVSLPRFERVDMQSNIFLYRNEIFANYNTNDKADGIYHAYPLNANNKLPADQVAFTDLEYSQNVVNLYPQLNRDNIDENPKATKTFALRSPLGAVGTNYPERSITRETVDKLNKDFGIGLTIGSVVNGVDNSTITFERNHNLGGLVSGVPQSGSSGYTNGTYYNVKIFTDSGLSTWKGTLADIVVSSQVINKVTIKNPGSGWSASDSKGYYDTNVTTGIGAGSGGHLSANTSGSVLTDAQLGNNTNLTIQFTGSETTGDLYYRMTTVPGTNQIGIATAVGDTRPTTDQYAFIVGPSIQANAAILDGTATFTSTTPHGLVKGNKFQYNRSTNTNRGEFVVASVTSPTKFTSKTTLNNQNISNGWVLKHGLSANDSVSQKDSENLASRGAEIFNYEVATGIVGDQTTNPSEDDVIHSITLLNSKSGIIERFPYGSYIQIGDEIVRVKSSQLLNSPGSNNTKIKVIRGVLGTQKQNHGTNPLLLKSIRPIPIEFHRPSILRASGHTFEYLGYGPGNYSTALPQVQVKTLTEQEEFLSQSQERGAGAVVYTGMNNKGDFYIGNQKKSALTGEEITFDTPIPTVAGEDPARLSVVFDEVTVKERLVVEGGKSQTSLSEFDGPVTFNNDVQFKKALKLKSGDSSTSTSSGALQVTGGVGISENLHVGGTINSTGTITGNVNGNVTGDISGSVTDTGLTAGRVVLAGTGGELTDSGNLTFNTTSSIMALSGQFKPTTSADATPAIIAENTGGQGSVIQRWKGNGDAIELQGTENSVGDYYLVNTGGAKKNGIRFHNGDTGLKFMTDDTLRMKIEGDTGIITIEKELRCKDDITAYYSSDRNLKDNISPIKQALDKVKSISGNTFDWNEKSQYEGKVDTGVIAQEIEALDLPGLTTTRDNGFKAVRYEKLVPLLIESIKELSAKVEKLESMAHPKPTGKTQKRNEDRLDAIEKQINN
jgi:hypothetical protein